MSKPGFGCMHSDDLLELCDALWDEHQAVSRIKEARPHGAKKNLDFCHRFVEQLLPQESSGRG